MQGLIRFFWSSFLPAEDHPHAARTNKHAFYSYTKEIKWIQILKKIHKYYN